MKEDPDYALRQLKKMLHSEKTIIEEFRGVTGRYHESAVRLAQSHLPSLEKAIRELEVKNGI